jgi:transposase
MENKERGGNRRRVLEQEHVEWLESKVVDYPDITVNDLHRQLNQHFDFQPHVSLSSVLRAIREGAGFTLKLPRQEPADYNSPERIQHRQAWTQEFLEMGGSMMEAVYIDEAGFNLHLARRFGRSRRGRRAVQVRPTQRGRNISLVVAIGMEGVIAAQVRLGAFNTERYNEFLRDGLLPALNGPRTLIQDNVPFHRSLVVQETIEEAGHICMQLPPYSPHLNAAEWVFSNIKTHVRRQDFQDQRTLTQHIEDVIGAIEADKCTGWIREVNRNFVKANRGEPLGQFYT